MPLLAVTLIFASSLHAQNAKHETRREHLSSGAICIAPVARPTAGEKSLSNSTGGNHVSSYTVQVDDKPAVVTSDEKGLRVTGLPTGKRHLVKIYGDGKLLHSFRFTYADYRSSELCLWFNPLYETWSLWKAKDAGAKCRCEENAKK
jgi:hypothetical protein